MRIRRFSSDISLEELQSCFHLPTEQACKRLGVGLTILKHTCRRFGLPRWPYKKPTKNSYTQRVTEVPNGGAYHGYSGGAALTPAPLPAQYNPAPSPFSWAQHPAALAGVNLGWGSIPPPASVAAQQSSLMARPQPRRAGAGDASLRALAAAPKGYETHLSNESDNDRMNLLLHAIEQSEEEGDDSDAGAAGFSAPSPRSPVSIHDTLQDATNAVNSPAAHAEADKAAAAMLLSQALSHLGSNAADDSKSAAVVTLVDILASNPALAQQLAAVLSAAAPVPPPAPAAPRTGDLAAAMHAELRKLQEQHHAQQAQAAALAAAPTAAETMIGHLRALQDMQRQYAAAHAAPNPATEAAELAARFQAAHQAKAAARQAALQRLHAQMAMREALSRQAGPAYDVAPGPAPAAQDQAALLQLLAAKLAQG